MITARRPYAHFTGLWWLTGIVLFVLSAETVWAARGGSSHLDLHALVVGSVEVVGAVLFLIPRSVLAGSLLLLIVLSIAFVVHAVGGQFRGDLLVYAAVVGFVATNASAVVTVPTGQSPERRAVTAARW